MAIFFHDDNLYSGLKGKKEIKSWIEVVLIQEEKIPGEINIILTTDQNLREINRDYLKRDYYTDIITFNYTENQIVNGDLYVSLERVYENAKEYEQEQKTELLRVIIHGILHLIGYDDESQENKKMMREKENKYLKTFLY